MNKPIHDPMSYRKVIEEAFPNALINEAYLSEDGYIGWNICPTPGHFIRFRTSEQLPLEIRIRWYSAFASYNGAVHYSESGIFLGKIPANKNSEPDYNFLVQLLKIYQSVG